MGGAPPSSNPPTSVARDSHSFSSFPVRCSFPLLWRRYTREYARLVPNLEHIVFHHVPANCAPMSVITTLDTPNRLTHSDNIIFATFEPVISLLIPGTTTVYPLNPSTARIKQS